MSNLTSNQPNQAVQLRECTTAVGFNFFDPEQFATMQRVSKFFATSELVPDMYRIKNQQTPPANATPEQIQAVEKHNEAEKNKAMANCMIALEISNRIGASPLMVMQNLIIIYGRPSWSSKFLISTVNTCGRFNPLQFRFTNKGMLGNVTYTDYVYDPRTRSKQAVQKTFDGKAIANIECVAYTTQRGSDKVLESSPISLRMAIEEGWYTKNGSKWQTMPQQMLMYRAASFWTNVYAPELSMGMRTIEEQQDIIDVSYEDLTNRVQEQPTQQAPKPNLGADIINASQEKTPAGSAHAPENVDKETGEIRQDPPAEAEPTSPGF